ncbi:MAG: STAS domain-containing protein [Verrucomicrobiota bacterium]
MKSSLKTEVVDDQRIVFLVGSVNAQNSANVLENVEAAAEGWVEKTVILSLAKVDYISSAALRIFMQLWQAAKGCDCELILAEPTPAVLEVLEMTGFQNIFRIIQNLEEASR